MAAEDKENAPAELASWKDIANRLGVSIRTAQKWEVERGLPVRRLPGERGRVVASVADLERWERTVRQQPGWWGSIRFFRVYALALTGLVVSGAVLGVALYLGQWRPGPPAVSRLESRCLVVTDREGRERWRYVFPDLLSLGSYPALGWIQFVDLEGDGTIETLFVYISASSRAEGDYFYCFSENGDVRWRYRVERKVRDSRREFMPPYGFRAFRVIPAERAGGAARIVVSFVHHYLYPGHVAVLDAGGRLVGEYWHSGHLSSMETLDLDDDGVDEVLLAGVNSGRRRAVLIALDPRSVSGASAQADGDPRQLQDFAPGTEKAQVWFPRTPANQKLFPFNVATEIVLVNGNIAVYVNERIREAPEELLYALDQNLSVVGLWAQHGLEKLHLERPDLGPLDLEELQRKVEIVRRWD